jgi:hypothetical protein
LSRGKTIRRRGDLGYQAAVDGEGEWCSIWVELGSSYLLCCFDFTEDKCSTRRNGRGRKMVDSFYQDIFASPDRIVAAVEATLGVGGGLPDPQDSVLQQRVEAIWRPLCMRKLD